MQRSKNPVFDIMIQGHIVTPHFFKNIFDTVPHIGLSPK
jgi:hypothetical protein